MDAQAEFAPLFGALQHAIGRVRKSVLLGDTGTEMKELLLESRQLLAALEQYAYLAPEDTRDSLLDLCHGADRSLSKLEHDMPRGAGREVSAPTRMRRAR